MRNIPTITRNLLIINVLVFLITVLVGGTTYQGGTDYTLNSQFGLYFFLAPNFHVYQLVTYMFMHGGWDHLFFNMFALWMFGCVVERVWGAKKFLFYYISCGIGAGLFQEMAQFADYMGLFGQATVNLGTTVGASGAIYAILSRRNGLLSSMLPSNSSRHFPLLATAWPTWLTSEAWCSASS